jgi:tetratricopeptide (TPR) repeat protein
LKLVYIALAVLLTAFGYFFFNPSYKLSTEARFFYSIADYEEAHRLASEALKIDNYNSMAIHIKSRSGKTLEISKFNRESKEASEKVMEIIRNKGVLLKADKVRIKMMSEIIIGNYEKLHLKVVDDEVLKTEARKHYERFLKLKKEAVESLKEHE